MPTGVGIGLGIMGAGAIGGLITGSNQAEAEGNAAMASLNASLPTADELANLDAMLKQQSTLLENQGAMLKRQTAILGATDPALMEASKQAYDILKGKQTGATSAYQTLAEREKDSLREQLASELGGNYASTTIGQRALRDLNERQQFNTQQLQNNMLGSLLGTAQSYQNSGINQTNLATDNYSHALAMRANALNAMKSRSLPYAGAPYVEDIQKQRALGNLFGSLSGMGGMIAGNGMQQNMFNQAAAAGRTPNMNMNYSSLPQNQPGSIWDRYGSNG